MQQPAIDFRRYSGISLRRTHHKADTFIKQTLNTRIGWFSGEFLIRKFLYTYLTKCPPIFVIQITSCYTLLDCLPVYHLQVLVSIQDHKPCSKRIFSSECVCLLFLCFRHFLPLKRIGGLESTN